jgi:hypothetical protein
MSEHNIVSLEIVSFGAKPRLLRVLGILLARQARLALPEAHEQRHGERVGEAHDQTHRTQDHVDHVEVVRLLGQLLLIEIERLHE